MILMDMIQLSQTSRKIRLGQNMTIEQLAQKSGFSKGFISQVENFRTTPSLKVLQRIADALQRTPNINAVILDLRENCGGMTAYGAKIAERVPSTTCTSPLRMRFH